VKLKIYQIQSYFTKIKKILMKKLSIKKSPKVIITRSDVLQFEKEICIVLPDYFRNFLIQNSGVITDECIFEKRYDVAQFLHLNPVGNAPSIKRIWEAHLFYEVKGYFPFALDARCWDINFSLKKETYGQIWVNCEEDNYETAEECYQFVAGSLDDFINGLERRENVPGW
jgi:SMI1 / KNR4 family (SUKH-1)